jgi:hypothetical protein
MDAPLTLPPNMTLNPKANPMARLIVDEKNLTFQGLKNAKLYGSPYDSTSIF